MMTQARGTTASEGGVGVRSESVAPQESTFSKRPRHAGEGSGNVGDRHLDRDVNAKNQTTHATSRSRGPKGDNGEEEEEKEEKDEEPSGSTDEQECTPPAFAGVGDEPEVLYSCRMKSHLTTGRARGPEGRKTFSILDRMNAKFSSMPTSPPPPTSRSTKVRHL